MNIVFAMILSIGIKAVSAVIEIAIQMLITNKVGISEYGNYTFFVSLIEGGYFLLFSGSVKLNTFYLSTPSSSLSAFKKKFSLNYVLPVVLALVLASAVMRNSLWAAASMILLLFYFAYDTSSVFFSRGHQLPALLGEYLIGRITLLLSLITMIRLDRVTSLNLLLLYGLQFAAMLLWFIPFRSKLLPGTEEVRVPMRKLAEYQISDVATSLISYSPPVLQYLVGGAFTAGLTGIISLVKKFINFISGPTAKVFLPEFSRLYKNGEREKLAQSYLMIVRIQMVFLCTIGSVLIGFPRLILHMFSPELEQYGGVFTAAAACLLLIAGIGPVTGLLQMTGNEHVCNRNQWISIGFMLLTCLALRGQVLFAVYGLCVQALTEGLMKYVSICRWFGKNIVPVRNYILLWLPVAFLRLAVDHMQWQYSYSALVIGAALVFSWNISFALRDPMVKAAVTSKIKSASR